MACRFHLARIKPASRRSSTFSTESSLPESAPPPAPEASAPSLLPQVPYLFSCSHHTDSVHSRLHTMQACFPQRAYAVLEFLQAMLSLSSEQFSCRCFCTERISGEALSASASRASCTSRQSDPPALKGP